MKKLYFAGAGIVLLLLFSLWAKNANFNLRSMMQTPINALGPTGAVAEDSSKSQTSPSPIPVEIIITVTPYGFVPDALAINPGTKITWINKSGTDANVTSNPHPTSTDYPDLDLGNFWNNGSVSLVFTKAGRFGYHNSLIPSQKGTIIVK